MATRLYSALKKGGWSAMRKVTKTQSRRCFWAKFPSMKLNLIVNLSLSIMAITLEKVT